MPGTPLTVSAATTEEYATPTASRTPVKISGSAAGSTTSLITSRRDAPSARAASTRPVGAPWTAAAVATATGGSAAMASSHSLGVSSMPNQMISRLKYASGGSARTNVTAGSATRRIHGTVPRTTPRASPAPTPSAEPMRMRRRLIARCSTSR